MSLGRAIGNAFGGLGDAAGGAGAAGRGIGGAVGGAGDAAGSAGAAGRGIGGAVGGVGDIAGGVGGAGRGIGGAGGAGGDAGRVAGRAADDTPLDNAIPPNTPERRAAAIDPENPSVPSREGGLAPGDVKVGGKWKAAKNVLIGTATVAVVAAAVTVTALMLKKANDGAKNDGKTYNIKLLKNKSTSGNIVTCQFSPSIDPNGVVVGDSITISGTGTSLDGNDYTITTKTASHTTCEFDAGKRLTADVKDKGSFVLHTSFENQMDNQAKDLGSGIGGFFSNIFQGLFGGLFGEAANIVGYMLIACCVLACCLGVLFAVSQMK